VRAPDRDFEEALTWRVSQWEWVEDDVVDAVGADGGWALRAHAPISVSDVLAHLPAPVGSWVSRVTEQAVEMLEHVAIEEPEFASAADRLRAELEASR
jgi:hypothetical protein